MAELKPCPFCGGEPKLKVCDGSGTYWSDLTTVILKGRKMTHYLIMCSKCRIKTGAYKTTKGVFNAWNRRVDNE